MRLHYKGAYDLNPESIPHKEHIPGAVKFKEAEDTKELSKTATVISIIKKGWNLCYTTGWRR